MSFFKFPSTPHLTVLPGLEIRDDKVLSEAERDQFLAQEITIEEKVDGANLGISFTADGAVQLQNRGEYLREPLSGQWKPIKAWMESHLDALFDLLEDRLILFGEWCYARHSVSYTNLPDWFLAFDVWDKAAERFWSTCRRDTLVRSAGLASVRTTGKGHFRFSELERFFSVSAYGEELVEGIYLRREDTDWLLNRAKLVRPAFIQSVEEHWSRSGICRNTLASGPSDFR